MKLTEHLRNVESQSLGMRIGNFLFSHKHFIIDLC